MKMVFAELVLFDYIGYFFTLVGIYVTVIYLIQNVKSVIMIIKSLLYPYFQPQLNVPLNEKFGSWAVITGCTDGIGREYAFELARKGISIVLISRSQEKLVKTANEIESTFKVKTKWIVADFSKGAEVYKHIESELTGIPVGILVNNVGRMYDYPEELAGVPVQVLWDIININIGATTMMCRLLIKKLKDNGKGAIVNISSGSEMQPLPYMAVYAASKVYITSLTLALQYELSPYGIMVQLVKPMYVITKMNEYSSAVMKGGLLIPDAKSYAKFAVFTLGKSSQTTGYWCHGIQYAVMSLAPTFIRTAFASIMTKSMRQQYFAEKCKKEMLQT